MGGDGTAAQSAYAASKHGMVGLMRSFAHWLAKENIRVNSVHPTGVETPMIMNAAIDAWMAENPQAGAATENLLPVPMLDGGHLFFFVLEAVLGRPLSLRKAGPAEQLRVVLLMLQVGW